jgi:hypothetical protein
MNPQPLAQRKNLQAIIAHIAAHGGLFFDIQSTKSATAFRKR